MTATHDDTVAELQRVNAELRRERDAALVRETTLAEALARRNSDFGERIEHQAATIDVLKAMSASPGDPQPVFDLIVRRAQELCNVPSATLFQYDGERVHIRSDHRSETILASSALAAYTQLFPIRPTRGSISCRAILDRQIIHIRDLRLDPELAGFASELGHRSQVSVPLIRDDLAIGVITIGAQAPGGFSDSQIELLKTFAEQAVIAISSAETYRDLHETLEQQTATAEMLGVINSSPGDLAPVFDAMLDKALDLCGAAFGILLTYDGELFHHAAFRSIPPAYVEFMREHPPIYAPESAPGRLAHGERIVHLLDIADTDAYRSGDVNRHAIANLAGARTLVAVPFRRDSALVGAIVVFRQEVRPFSDKQIALLENFAAQAVIAIENTRLLTEQREALEQQTATAEVLQVINASPGNLEPVFDAMLEKALRLCDAAFGNLWTYDGEVGRLAAICGASPEYRAELMRAGPQKPEPGGSLIRLVEGEPLVHIADITAEGAHRSGAAVRRMLADRAGARTVLWVPMRKDGALLGFFTIYRTEVRPFTAKQITLLESFAAQAVIAMENARLITEQREALEQQTATAEVLQVINASPGNLTPVFEAMLEKAIRLCGGDRGVLWTIEGGRGRLAAARGLPAEFVALLRERGESGTNSPLQRVVQGEWLIEFPDTVEEFSRSGDPHAKGAVEAGVRSAIWVAIVKEGVTVGAFAIGRSVIGTFSDKQIALLQNFAAQAVIAMENARLLNEIRKRQEELRITFENMGDGVAMFDETPRLVAWNSKFQEIMDLSDGVLAERPTFPDYIRYLAERGEYGARTNPEEEIRNRVAEARRYRLNECVRPDGRVIEIRQVPVAVGGFVIVLADITERKRNEDQIRAARDAAEEASRTIEAAYRDLKAAQANLIQAEKMASLGQLTAGIAHEIKNPLNFVNNFADLSVELLNEMKETVASALPLLDEDKRGEIGEAVAMVTANLEKISEHGKRADNIVKAMLEHSRGSSGERRMVDLNALIDEALNLAYHGARAQDQSFNITLERDLGEGIAPIEVNPQDITRVFLNIFSNGFYAATMRSRNGVDDGFVPTLKVTTIDAGDAVDIRVRDNGTGIPADIRDKLFQPFFTTKPTGEGTGLGLSITYDIVTKAHGGSIAVDSKVGDYSEFTIRLPRKL